MGKIVKGLKKVQTKKEIMNNFTLKLIDIKLKCKSIFLLYVQIFGFLGVLQVEKEQQKIKITIKML